MGIDCHCLNRRGEHFLGDAAIAKIRYGAIIIKQQADCFRLVDFACVRASELLEEVFDIYGDTVNYFGAGCGNGDRSPGPVIFSPEGLHTGAAVVAKLRRRRRSPCAMDGPEIRIQLSPLKRRVT